MGQRRYELLPERTRVWTLAATVCFVLLAARLGWVQVVKHAYYTEKAKQAVGRHWDLPAPRGNIYDRNSVPLALNLKLFSISADPYLMEGKDTKEAAQARAEAHAARVHAAKLLAPVLVMPEAEVLARLEPPGQDPKKPVRFVRLREDVDEQVKQKVEALKLPGVISKVQVKRVYPHGVVGASLLGFVGADMTGLSGIEARFNKTLAGTPGKMFVMLDGRLPRSRTPIPGRSVVEKEMQPGQSLVLTIDLTLQRAADEALAAAVKSAHAKGGAAVVMDPKTGEVLALANQPTFDPNQYQKSDKASWGCQAVTSPYEPGSTFKSITACAALESGRYAHGETVTCNGSRTVGNRTISCAHGHHGAVDLHEMIVRSCNVGLGTVALSLGPSRLYDWVRKLGFGARTGIELAGETPGLLMPAKTWSLVQTANIGFGQGVSVTPIQLLSAYCTIANGGFKVRPHVVKMISSEGKMEALALPAPERVLSEETASYMRSALQGVVEEPHGTGSAARIPMRTVGGKTGTAQKPTPEAGYRSGKYVGSFVGFAPVKDPRLAVIVVIDEPQGSHYGGVVAAPAFRQITQMGLSYLHVPLDKGKEAKSGEGGSAAE